MSTTVRGDDPAEDRAEEKLDENLERKECPHTEDGNDGTVESEIFTPIYGINSRESLARNRKILKDLEVTRARLRTYAAYSPTDSELRKIAAQYRRRLQRNIREPRSCETKRRSDTSI